MMIDRRASNRAGRSYICPSLVDLARDREFNESIHSFRKIFPIGSLGAAWQTRARRLRLVYVTPTALSGDFELSFEE